MNEHANYKNGYIVFEDSGTSPIAYGACEKCSGLGADFVADPNLIIPDDTLSINQGAIYPWSKKSSTDYYDDVLKSVCGFYKIDMDVPFKDLPIEHQNIILYGSDEPVKITVKQFGTHRYRTQYQMYILFIVR